MTNQIEALHEDAARNEESAHVLAKRLSDDRSQFAGVLRKCIQKNRIDIDSSVLVIGGTQEDAQVLRQCGFHRITLSNIAGVPADQDNPGDLPIIAVDAEDIRLPDNSYDTLFIHQVIHHCRSPHRALCESLRVAKHHVLMMEPNDSAFMRLLCRLRFSFPFELAAVVDNDYVRGGVSNSQIPNYIFRWNEHEVSKLICSFLPEYTSRVYADPYWDMNVSEKELALRKQTRIGSITRLIGAKNFLRILGAFQFILNCVPGFRRHGNKFFCCILKNDDLQPWLALGNDGQIVFKRSFQSQPK
jgi:SAM-dependent methyltransferase